MQVMELGVSEIKEAGSLPIYLVLALERLFPMEATRRPILAFFLGWILCLLFALLRFNDGIRVSQVPLNFEAEFYMACAGKPRSKEETWHSLCDRFSGADSARQAQ